jgi:hypothetical protein
MDATKVVVSRDSSNQETCWRDNARIVRVFRFAFGVSLSVMLAYGIEWHLSFITTIFVATLLGNTSPCPNLKTGFIIWAFITLAMLFGLLISSTVLHYPVICSLIIGVILWHILHYATRGGNPLVIAFSIIGITLIPILSLSSWVLSAFVAKGMIFGVAIAITLVWLSHLIFPDSPDAVAAEAVSESSLPVDEVNTYERHREIWSKFWIVYPLVIMYFAFNMSGTVVVLIFIAILASTPGLQAGVVGAKALVLGNLYGGLAAIVVYNLLVAVPEYGFLVSAMTLVALIFASQIFSAKPNAPLFGTGMTTVLLLIGTATMPGADEAGIKFFTRILMIMGAGIYVALAFNLVHRLQARKPG